MSASTLSTVPDTVNGIAMEGFPDYASYLHVVAAVIEDNEGQILIARRHRHLHQGGLWEFPGGKVESGESVPDALERELAEELGIIVREATPLIRIPYEYPDRKVLLDVWRVAVFEDTPHGAEGQEIAWVEREALRQYDFPAANTPIITAARLPERYLITPEPGEPQAFPAFLKHLEEAIAKGNRLIQFRAKTLDSQAYLDLADKVITLGHRCGAEILLNAEPSVAEKLGADGVHLTASRLMALEERPLGENRWVAASCHTLNELHHAMETGVDFAVVSPVKVTTSHPSVPPIGWQGFRYMTEHAGIPVFALGGMELTDLSDAWKYGGQGIAAIGSLWPGEK